MSELVDPTAIEGVVGASRHEVAHLGRAVSAEETVYILHSTSCKASGVDLRLCAYSVALDRGINTNDWARWMDRAVVLDITRAGSLFALCDADEADMAVALGVAQ